MECLNQAVDINVWKAAHQESGQNREMPANDLDVLFTKDEPGQERERVKEILRQQYGLTLTWCQRLDGFDDANYLVKVKVVDENHLCRKPEMPSPSQYVLRIINAQDSRQPDRIKAINDVMKHVQAKGIVTQLPVVNLQGQELSFCTLETGVTSTTHVVVLRTFVPGTSMASRTLTPTDLYNCGVLVSRITQAFEDFHHPFFDTFQFSWSLDNQTSFRKMLPSIEDSSQRRLLETIMDAVDKKLSQMRHLLKRRQIHGDIGTSNIILPHQSGPPAQDSTHQKTWAVSGWGVVDFHDTHESYSLYELATSVSRIMSRNQPTLPNKLDIPGHILAGYQTAIPLDSSERDIFPYLVLSCLCSAVVGCQYYSSLIPENGEYLRNSLYNGMSNLEALWKMTPSQAQIRWEQVAGSYH